MGYLQGKPNVLDLLSYMGILIGPHLGNTITLNWLADELADELAMFRISPHQIRIAGPLQS